MPHSARSAARALIDVCCDKSGQVQVTPGGRLATSPVATALLQCGIWQPAGRALLIHCENDTTRDFYLRLAKFDASPTDPLHLFLLMKDLRKALETT
jgi:hypothetical protein